MYIVAVACMIVIVDQISKYLASDFFSQHARSIPLIPNIFHLTYVENTGIAFGMFKEHPNLLVAIIAISLLFITYYAIKTHQGRTLFFVSYGFTLGGAFGNIIDRLRLGFVVDFLDFRIWPVFNLADTFISVGVGLIILDMLFHKEKMSK
ncbi:MAG: signal peptidase II [Candidatus Omnitrophica bacterium]|nr:signal peptidase II [Candidatus Omnitrophota bacterium]